MVERYIVIVDAESSILSNRPIKNYELDALDIRSGSYATQLDIENIQLGAFLWRNVF